MSAGRLVVVGREQAPTAGEGPGPEEAARDHDAVRRLGLAVVGEIGAEPTVRGDAGEAGLQALEVAEHRVAEHLLAVAGLLARRGAGLGPGRAQVHQLAGRRHRQGPQQHLVEQREDGRIGANTQGQRQDGHEAQKGGLGQVSERQTQISHGV